MINIHGTKEDRNHFINLHNYELAFPYREDVDLGAGEGETMLHDVEHDYPATVYVDLTEEHPAYWVQFVNGLGEVMSEDGFETFEDALEAYEKAEF